MEMTTENLALPNSLWQQTNDWRHKPMATLYLLIMSTLYLISAISSEEFVKNRLPTIILKLGVEGYARMLTELGTVCGFLFAALVLVLYNFSIHRQNGFEIFKVFSSLATAEDVKLSSD